MYFKAYPYVVGCLKSKDILDRTNTSLAIEYYVFPRLKRIFYMSYYLTHN